MRSQRPKKTKAGARTNKSTPETAIGNLPRDLLKSILLTLCVGASLIFTASLLLSLTADPLALTAPTGILITFFTALLGGFSAIRIHGQSALLCGLCNGSLLLAILLLLSLAFRGEPSRYAPTASLLLHLGIPFLSVAGAYLGRAYPKRKKRRRKRL